MKLTKLFGLTVLAMLALTGLITATAQAEELPNILPIGTANAPILARFTSGESTFGNGILKVTSVKDLGFIDLNSTKLGSFDALFEESTTGVTGLICTGLDDTEVGSILAKGTFHIRDYDENGTLRVALIFLLKPVHFECEGGILVVVSGCVAGDLTPVGILTKTLTVTLAKGTGNNNLIITVLNEANSAKETCQLLAKEGTGATKLSVEVSTETITDFTKHGTGRVEVLVMRL